MITGPNNNALGKYITESTAGKAVAPPITEHSVDEQASAPGPSNSNGQVSLSKEAQMLQQLEMEINSYPSVDAEKVESIKLQLASGGYNINTSSVASKIMLLDSLY